MWLRLIVDDRQNGSNWNYIVTISLKKWLVYLVKWNTWSIHGQRGKSGKKTVPVFDFVCQIFKNNWRRPICPGRILPGRFENFFARVCACRFPPPCVRPISNSVQGFYRQTRFRHNHASISLIIYLAAKHLLKYHKTTIRADTWY